MKSGRLDENKSLLKRLWLLVYLRTIQLWNALRAKPFVILLFAAVFIYGVVFSYFTVLKHSVFQSYALDLGVFDQALYTTVHDGKFFYYTVDLFLNPSGCYFAQHVSPVLFVVLPFYAVSPSPVTLLVFKSFILAFAALPLYRLAKELLKSDKASFLIALIYLLYAPLQGANWFDFQPQIFLPFLFFSMFYFVVKSNWKLYFVTVVLSAMVLEQVSVLIFLIGAYLLAASKVCPFWKSLISIRHLNQRSAGLITMVFSGCYFFLAFWIRNSFPINPQYLETYEAVGNLSVLGVKGGNPLLFPVYVLISPIRAADALLYDFPLKLMYVVLLFAPLLFVSFRSKLVIAAFPFLGLFLLSNYAAYYTVGAHYPLYIVGVIFLAALFGLKRFQSSTRRSLLKSMLLVSLVLTTLTSPLSPLAGRLVNQGALWYPSDDLVPDEKTDALNRMLSFVPANASVLTQNHIFPHVSSRINAYVIPLPNFSKDTEYLGFLINKSDYVLLDTSTEDNSRDFVLREIKQNNSHRAYVLDHDAMLFKRDLQYGPILLYTSTFSVQDGLYVDSGTIVNESSSQSGRVALSVKGLDQGIATYGPYMELWGGNYSAVFLVKTLGTEQSAVIGFDVCSGLGNQIVTRMELNSTQFSDGKWFKVTLPFSLNLYTSEIEFRTTNNGLTNLYVDTITLQGVESGTD